MPLSSISVELIAVIAAGVSTTVELLFKAVTTISSTSSAIAGRKKLREMAPMMIFFNMIFSPILML